MLLLRGAASETDISHIGEAERRAWADPFLSSDGRQLVNQTRIITGSSAVQSVTWLHRNGRNDSSGALERLTAAALAAQSAAGWGLAAAGNNEADGQSLRVRCIESIRYSVGEEDQTQTSHKRNSGGDSDGDDEAGEKRARDEEGWHMDEWSVMTAVVVLSTSQLAARLRSTAAVAQLQRTCRRATCWFRSWDAHRSKPVLRGERHILVIELWQARNAAECDSGPPRQLPGGWATLCEPALQQMCHRLRCCGSAARWRTTPLGSLSKRRSWWPSAFLWEMAASAQAMQLLDELERADSDTATYSSSLESVTASPRQAVSRTAALVPNKTAEMPWSGRRTRTACGNPCSSTVATRRMPAGSFSK